MIREGDPVTVHYPEGSRDGTAVSYRYVRPKNVEHYGRGEWEKRYVVLFDDDESADPAVHESLVEPRGQEALL